MVEVPDGKATQRPPSEIGGNVVLYLSKPNTPMSRQDRGRLGMRKRWGPPRTINLRDLPPEQRAFIAELVDVARRHAKSETVTDKAA